MQDILDHVQKFVSSGFLEMLKDKTLTVVRNNNVPQEEIEDLDATFAALHNIFSDLETETQRVNALEQSHCYIT